MLCSWEGDHRFGITLTLHRLSVILNYGLSGLKTGAEHSACAQNDCAFATDKC